MNDRTVSYQPGSWFGVVGEHATVLLPGSEKARAGSLWAIIDDGAGFDAALDALLAGGLSNLPGFVLLATSDDVMRVFVRGDATATLTVRDEWGEDSTETVEGSPDSMWVERSFVGVTRYVVALPDQDLAGAPLSLVGGLVRVGGIEAPTVAKTAMAEEPARLASVVELVPQPPIEEEPEEEFDLDSPTEAVPLVPDPEPEHGVGLAAESTPLTPEDESGEPPVWEPPIPVVAPPLAPPPVASLPLPPVIPPPPPLVAPAPAVPPAWVEEATEQISQPEWEDAGVVAHLSFSSGEEIDVDRLVVIGRAPDAGRFSADEAPLLVAVPSPHSEISSTHLEVRPGSGPDHGSAVVSDLGSTNGTLVVQPGERPAELRPGVPVLLLSGALIDLGDGLTIRVTQG